MRARLANDSDWAGWASGTHDAAYEVLGAHAVPDQPDVWELRVWAPNALAVSVVGDFNGWNGSADAMERGPGGVWAGRVGAPQGSRYKFRISSDAGWHDKADPFAFHTEEPPGTASVLWDLDGTDTHTWGDAEWMAGRGAHQALDRPMSVYEVHVGSWDRREPVNYRRLGPVLAEYAVAHGFTHVELMPVMEHPFYG